MLTVSLATDDGFELPELGEPFQGRVFLTTHYDTADLRLAGAGVALRRREENGRQVWQLRLAGASRAALDRDGGPGAPPDELTRLLPALVRRRPLEAVAVVRTRRTGSRVRDDRGGEADVTFDSIAVLDGRRVTRTFEELEIELREGRKKHLRGIETVLRAAGASREKEPTPTLVRALGRPVVAPPDPRRAGSPAEAVQAMLAVQLRRLLEHDPGARLGVDPEDVHQFRVACRRLRASLRAARPLVEGAWGEELRAELRWLGGALGPVRDLDVLIADLSRETEELPASDRDALAPFFRRLADERDRARGALLAALDSDRYLDLLDRIEASAAAPAFAEDAATLRSIWRRELRRLRKRVRALPGDPSDSELHAARIAAKRARYAAELAEPELGKPGRRFVDRAKELQDVLGEHQDAVVAEERIRSTASALAEPSAQFAAGRLAERQRLRRQTARSGFGPAWTKLDRTGRKAAS